MNKKNNNADFVILTETIEKGCFAFQLLNVRTNKSKYISEYDAHSFKENFGICFCDMNRWIRKMADLKKKQQQEELPF